MTNPVPEGHDGNHFARKALVVIQNYRLWYSEWAVLLLSSIVVAISASVVSMATTWLATFRQGYCSERWYLTHHVCSEENWHDWPKPVGWFVYILLSGIYGTVAAFLVDYAPGSIMSGIVELKSFFQGFDLPPFLDGKTLLVKLIGIGLVSASGMWLGQEAPLVHVSATLTSILSRVLPVSESRRRELIQASTAAGLSVAFSAPLGGVLFGIEMFLPSKGVTWMMFVCSMVATVTLRSFVAPSSAAGGIVVPETGLFHVSYDRVWHVVEIIPFTLLGVIGGVYGAIVAKTSQLPRVIYKKYPKRSVACVSVATAALSYVSIASRIPSTELLVALFAECRDSEADSLFCSSNSHLRGLLYTLFLGLNLVPISFMLPVPSGILFPTIIIGALSGRVLGLVMREIFERLPGVLSTSFCPDSSQHCITPGVYALVGAGAMLTGVTKLTVSSVVLMFEITGALSFIVPIMTGVIVAKWVSDTLVGSESIYQAWDSDYRVPILPDSSATIPDLVASDIMTPASGAFTLEEAPKLDMLPSLPYRSVPIVDSEGFLIDVVDKKTGMPETTICLNPKASLRLVVSTMNQLSIHIVVICNRGAFKGLITRTDVINALNDHKFRMNIADVDEFEVESD